MGYNIFESDGLFLEQTIRHQSFLTHYLRHVDSPRTLDGIRNWLSSCQCSRRSYRPKLLIDLGEEAVDSVTVVSTENLALSDSVCLSYCWGGPQEFICTSSVLCNSGTLSRL